jgi:hypothetical protein
MASTTVAPSTLSTQHTTGFGGAIELMTDNGPYPLHAPEILNKAVAVWNGTEFVEGTPRQVSGKEVMQFVTSEGRVVRCSPSQLVPMADGTLKPAKDLRVADRLARSVAPAYPGRAEKTQSDAFKRGCIYGFALANMEDKVPELPMTVSAPLDNEYIVVPIEVPAQDPKDPKASIKIRSPHLVPLGYAEKRLAKDGTEIEVDVMRAAAVDYTRQAQKEFDHDAQALILLTQQERQVTTCCHAPYEDRMQWAAGCAMLTHKYEGLRGPRANIVAVASAINSLGVKYEVNVCCVDAIKNMWSIQKFRCPPEQRVAPYVFAISVVPGDTLVYNVEGVDTVMVNGQLMSTSSSA